MDRFTVGDAEIRRIEEMRAKFPASGFADQAFIDANSDWLKPDFVNADGTVDFVFQSWVVRVDDLVVVVDPCNGNGRSRPSLPYFSNLQTDFIERFERDGVDPMKVDIVFCTHLHCDHCGWNTQLRGGRWVPTFPNARYLFGRREYERWDPARAGYQPVDHNEGVYEDSIKPIVDAGLAELIGDAHRLSPSLETSPSRGHTIGHLSLGLKSAGDEAWFTGDAVHHPIQLARPEASLGGDEAPEEAAAFRRIVADHLSTTGALMIPAHFAGSHVGHVRKRDGRITFEPLAVTTDA
jgi:glyoxylase-like metal-dependent hydrolase (beta-lactamase superfamily II)